MRGFFTRVLPEPQRVLLIESASRETGARALETLKKAFGEQAPIDVFHCQVSPPAGVDESWRASDYAGGSARLGLVRMLRARRPSIAAAIFADDPTLGPWKWLLLATLSSKFLILNENGDFFWLDRGHLPNLFDMLQRRVGFAGETVTEAIAGLLAFPFVVAYLAAYAGYVHCVRAVRMALGLKHRARREPGVRDA